MSELSDRIAQHWDERAATFDHEPDHGLLDPVTRSAWVRRLESWLPAPPARVADLGCGTGTLTVLLASLGYDVTACDLAPEMVERARRKARAASVEVELSIGDAAEPTVSQASVDVVLVRHVVWMLPRPEAAIETWRSLLRPGGRLVMIEGRWDPAPPGENEAPEASAGDLALPWDGGVPAATLVPILERRFSEVVHHDLSNNDVLWGRAVQDERFAVVARTP